MTWLKGTWSALSAGILAALAIFAVVSASRQKASAQKWQDKAIDIEEGNVKAGTLTAEAASTKAKLHEAKAKQKRSAAEARITQIAEKDDEISSIIASWGT